LKISRQQNSIFLKQTILMEIFELCLKKKGTSHREAPFNL